MFRIQKIEGTAVSRLRAVGLAEKAGKSEGEKWTAREILSEDWVVKIAGGWRSSERVAP
jgi:hypothetical protein